MTHEEAQTILKDAASRIGEHFDAVQILATWNVDGLTMGTKSGVGNWYARLGLAREFLDQNQNEDSAEILSRKLNPPDEGEAWKA